MREQLKHSYLIVIFYLPTLNFSINTTEVVSLAFFSSGVTITKNFQNALLQSFFKHENLSEEMKTRWRLVQLKFGVLEVSRWWERQRVNRVVSPSLSARDSLKRVDNTRAYILAEKGVVLRPWRPPSILETATPEKPSPSAVFYRPVSSISCRLSSNLKFATRSLFESVRSVNSPFISLIKLRCLAQRAKACGIFGSLVRH